MKNNPEPGDLMLISEKPFEYCPMCGDPLPPLHIDETFRCDECDSEITLREHKIEQ